MATEFADTQADRPALSVEGQRFEISKAVNFEAAHRLPGRAAGDPYGRVHGHSFRLKATVAGKVQPGKLWVEDIAVLTTEIEAVATQLDHQMLNDIKGLETPTLENIAIWVAQRLSVRLPSLAEVTIERPSLNEQCRLDLTKP